MMRVLAAAAEVFPLVKTGGLADVVGALPEALHAHDVEMRVLVPGYPAVIAALKKSEVLHQYAKLFGGKAALLSGTAAGLNLFVLDAPQLYDRDGGPYVAQHGRTTATTGSASPCFARRRRRSPPATCPAGSRISSTPTTGRPR